EDTGVLAALDELPEVTFGELRRSAIPEEDVDLLFRSGVNNPEEEIKLVIQYARYRISRFHAHEPYPSKYASDAQPNLNRAADRVEKIDDVPPAKKRKLFNGIGRLLGGAITAGGNLLLLTGIFVAPNPATAYLALGSSALGITSIAQGIGDLRGE